MSPCTGIAGRAEISEGIKLGMIRSISNQFEVGWSLALLLSALFSNTQVSASTRARSASVRTASCDATVVFRHRFSSRNMDISRWSCNLCNLSAVTSSPNDCSLLEPVDAIAHLDGHGASTRRKRGQLEYWKGQFAFDLMLILS